MCLRPLITWKYRNMNMTPEFEAYWAASGIKNTGVSPVMMTVIKEAAWEIWQTAYAKGRNAGYDDGYETGYEVGAGGGDASI